MTSARAVAHPNLALVKYWGKQLDAVSVPATPSISINLKGLSTVTSVSEHHRDRFVLKGSERSDKKIAAWLKLLREDEDIPPIAIESEADFPANCGLASSAAGFAAATVALDKLLNWNSTKDDLARIARLGSVSAARSIFDGFVALEPIRGDCKACTLHPPAHWNLKVVIAITDENPKAISSSEGMKRSALTSPYYDAWIESSQSDFAECRHALENRDLEVLGRVIERSCTKMHALMLSSEPALIYWNACSLETIRAVQNLRHAGTPAFFTSDAGAQVKVICQAHDVDTVKEHLEQIHGVKRILVASVGHGAYAIHDC